MQLHGGADSNEKTRDRRGFVHRERGQRRFFVALRQLGGRSARVLGNDLLEDALGLVVVTQATLDVRQLVQRVGHLLAAGVALADPRESLAGTLQVALGQVHLAEPVLGVAGVLAVRVLAQEGIERLARLVEILALYQVEGRVVVELLLRRVARLATRRRCVVACGSRRRPIGIDGASRCGILCSGSATTGNPTVEVLVAFQAFLLELLDLVLLFLERATQASQLVLHLLELHEQFALHGGGVVTPPPAKAPPAPAVPYPEGGTLPPLLAATPSYTGTSAQAANGRLSARNVRTRRCLGITTSYFFSSTRRF